MLFPGFCPFFHPRLSLCRFSLAPPCCREAFSAWLLLRITRSGAIPAQIQSNLGSKCSPGHPPGPSCSTWVLSPSLLYSLLSPHAIFRAISTSCPAWGAGGGLISQDLPHLISSHLPVPAWHRMGSQGTPLPPCPVITQLGSKFRPIFSMTEQSSHH